MVDFYQRNGLSSYVSEIPPIEPVAPLYQIYERVPAPPSYKSNQKEAVRSSIYCPDIKERNAPTQYGCSSSSYHSLHCFLTPSAGTPDRGVHKAAGLFEFITSSDVHKGYAREAEEDIYIIRQERVGAYRERGNNFALLIQDAVLQLLLQIEHG